MIATVENVRRYFALSRKQGESITWLFFSDKTRNENQQGKY